MVMANFKYAADNRFILNIADNLHYNKKDSLTSNKVIQFQNNAKRVIRIKLEIRKKMQVPNYQHSHLYWTMQ